MAGQCSVGGINGRPQSFLASCSTIPEASVGVYSCILRYDHSSIPSKYHDDDDEEQMVIGTFRLSGLAAKAPGKAKSGQDGAATSDNCIGWAYVGSHNFTSSAWGTLSGSDFNPALNVSD